MQMMQLSLVQLLSMLQMSLAQHKNLDFLLLPKPVSLIGLSIQQLCKSLILLLT